MTLQEQYDAIKAKTDKLLAALDDHYCTIISDSEPCRICEAIAEFKGE